MEKKQQKKSSTGCSSFSMTLRSSKNKKPLQNPVQESVIKKIKTESSGRQGNVQGRTGPGSRRSKVKETSMNDLPAEMLMEILKCVNSPSLFNCRLLNRQWNWTSTRILQSRVDTETPFVFQNGQIYMEKMTSLGDFVTCMTASENSICPISRFHFWIEDSTPSEFFNHDEWTEFLSQFSSPQNPNQNSNQNRKIIVKSLKLQFSFCYNDATSLTTVTEKLRDFLLVQAPNLEEFNLMFLNGVEAPGIRLFSPPSEQDAESQTIPAPVPVECQLPHLKVIRFVDDMFFEYPGICKDLINAAVNLERIEVEGIGNDGTAFLEFLFSLGKPCLLQRAKLEIDEELLSFIGKLPHPNHNPVLKFEELELTVGIYNSSVPSGRRLTRFLFNLFQSSKTSLRKLKMVPLGFLHRLQLPHFKNLRELNLHQYHTFERDNAQVFPDGIRSLDIFPLVTTLTIQLVDWRRAFPQENSIPILRKVENLRLHDRNFSDLSISVLASMCPNLKNFHIEKYEYRYGNEPGLNLLLVGRAIWTLMKTLESLEMDIHVDSQENTPSAMDSCFTGISLENCQRFREMMEAKITLEKYGVSVDISESKLKAEREHPSILDMKDLKKMVINPYKNSSLTKGQDFFKLTWISQEYAFKFMPNVQFGGVNK